MHATHQPSSSSSQLSTTKQKQQKNNNVSKTYTAGMSKKQQMMMAQQRPGGGGGGGNGNGNNVKKIPTRTLQSKLDHTQQQQQAMMMNTTPNMNFIDHNNNMNMLPSLSGTSGGGRRMISQSGSTVDTNNTNNNHEIRTMKRELYVKEKDIKKKEIYLEKFEKTMSMEKTNLQEKTGDINRLYQEYLQKLNKVDEKIQKQLRLNQIQELLLEFDTKDNYFLTKRDSLMEKESKLKEYERDLGTRNEALNKREHGLGKVYQDLDKQKVNLENLEKDAISQKDTLNIFLSSLTMEKVAVNEKMANLQNRELEIISKEEKLIDYDNEMNTKRENLQKHEIDVKEKERQVKSREEATEGFQKKLNAYEKVLSTTDKKLKTLELELIEANEKLKSAQQQLYMDQENAALKKLDLDMREMEIVSQEDYMIKRRKELEDKFFGELDIERKKVEKANAELDVRIRNHEVMQTSLNAHEQYIFKRLTEVAERSKKLDRVTEKQMMKEKLLLNRIKKVVEIENLSSLLVPSSSKNNIIKEGEHMAKKELNLPYSNTDVKEALAKLKEDIMEKKIENFDNEYRNRIELLSKEHQDHLITMRREYLGSVDDEWDKVKAREEELDDRDKLLEASERRHLADLELSEQDMTSAIFKLKQKVLIKKMTEMEEAFTAKTVRFEEAFQEKCDFEKTNINEQKVTLTIQQQEFAAKVAQFEDNFLSKARELRAKNDAFNAKIQKQESQIQAKAEKIRDLAARLKHLQVIKFQITIKEKQLEVKEEELQKSQFDLRKEISKHEEATRKFEEKSKGYDLLTDKISYLENELNVYKEQGKDQKENEEEYQQKHITIDGSTSNQPLPSAF